MFIHMSPQRCTHPTTHPRPRALAQTHLPFWFLRHANLLNIVLCSNAGGVAGWVRQRSSSIETLQKFEIEKMPQKARASRRLSTQSYDTASWLCPERW
jgi:hypothetical protein